MTHGLVYVAIPAERHVEAVGSVVSLVFRPPRVSAMVPWGAVVVDVIEISDELVVLNLRRIMVVRGDTDCRAVGVVRLYPADIGGVLVAEHLRVAHSVPRPQ